MPQNAAGRITEPTVCVPSANWQNPAATAAAEPLLDPPGVCAKLCGLRVGPGSSDANSVVTVLARTIAPASCSLVTQLACGPVNRVEGSCDPAWVEKPSTRKISLTPSRTP